MFERRTCHLNLLSIAELRGTKRRMAEPSWEFPKIGDPSIVP